MSRISRLCLAVALAAIAAPNARGEVDEAFQRLVNARSLKCEYASAVQAEWKDGKPKPRISKEHTMTLQFDSIDLKRGRVRIIGNQGAADASAFVTPNGVHIVEQSPLGNVNYTTIFAEFVSGTRDFATVSSRHISINGAIPSQWYGSCQVWE